MTLPAENTLLILDGIGVPLYSARGLSESFSLISQANQLERSCNGSLIDFAPDWGKKYALTISCTDQEILPPDSLKPGDTVTVSCVSEFHCLAADTPASFVSGSDRIEGAFKFYRPVLNMTVIDFTMQTDEYSGAVSWSLKLEETGDDEGTGA